MSNSFYFKIILASLILLQIRIMHPFQVVPLKNTTVLLIPYKNKLCRSFVNSALKLRQLAIKYCPGSDKNSD
jgi:hypothetical protein